MFAYFLFILQLSNDVFSKFQYIALSIWIIVRTSNIWKDVNVSGRGLIYVVVFAWRDSRYHKRRQPRWSAPILCLKWHHTGCSRRYPPLTEGPKSELWNFFHRGLHVELKLGHLRCVYTGPPGWSTRLNQRRWIQRLNDTVYTVPQKWKRQSISKWRQMNSCGKELL